MSDSGKRWVVGRGVKRHCMRGGAHLSALAGRFVPAISAGNGEFGRCRRELQQSVLRCVDIVDEAGVGQAQHGQRERSRRRFEKESSGIICLVEDCKINGHILEEKVK